MGTGIIVCGLNGAGKSTLGKVLAEELNFRFIDNEDLYFPKTNPNYTYASPRTHEEVEQLLLCKIKKHKSFVFASVKGDYGEAVLPFFRLAVVIDVPKDIRLQRVRDRSFRKFGNRMLRGGDLYEQEEKFFDLVSSRAEDTVDEWLLSLSCPIIRIDGTKPIEENIRIILNQLQSMTELELLNSDNAVKVMEIERDDVPACFAEDVAYTIELAKYGEENNLRGHCYAIKYADKYIGIILIGEAIEDDADPIELKGTGYFRVIGFMIDKRYRSRGIGSKALETALNNIYCEYGAVPVLLECHKDNKKAIGFYEKMGFRNTNILNDQDYFFIKHQYQC